MPLFHPRQIRERLARHSFPPDLEERHARLLPWILRLESGELERTKEVSLHAAFLEGICGRVLGYRTWSDGGSDTWDLTAEAGLGTRGGHSADGALGWFGPGLERVHAPIELKGAGQLLDHAAGRALTPVQQAWDYANRSPAARWIILSNYKETRLYSRARTPDEYEVFKLADLADPGEFRRFWLLLSREALLPRTPEARSLCDELLLASVQAEKEVTATLYGDYSGLRRELFQRLLLAHSNLPPLDVLRHAQKLLDRFLFIAFAEDRALLPPNTIRQALDHVDDYNPRTVWDNLKAVFRWIDLGNAARGFPPYNGGLFAEDPELDALEPSDEVCRGLRVLGGYDFREDVSVEVLGHIFEQSITDLEELRGEVAGTERSTSRRKADGVFYTPSFVTRYIVGETLGRALRERFDAIVERMRPEGVRGANRQRDAWIGVWTAYREEVRSLRVLDPACGSGAFLIAAFDALHAEYGRVNARLATLRGGQHELFDLDRAILNGNLFGVDLNDESVEITKLSLWLKTAAPGNKLTWLDGNIRCGNSVVNDPRVHPRAFDWARRDAPSSWHEGFDVVIGNPPYVRQELLSVYKDHWRERFAAFDGVADLYVYFFELGLNVLKPGGRLGFVVANKWLKAGYAAPLRRLLAGATEIETLIDFGHAPIFPDADAFPSIITFRKPVASVGDRTVEVTQFPRGEVDTVSLAEYVRGHRQIVPQARFGASQWSLEEGRVEALMAKLRERGVPLTEYAGCKPCRGLLTGLNEAFMVDAPGRDALVRADAGTADVLQRYLRGQDIGRWSPAWGGEWLIVIPSSGDRTWPWTGAADPEAVFRATYPALHARFLPSRDGLRARTDKGRYWWELRSCAYYDAFVKPKLIYQDIQFHPRYALDSHGLFTNNTAWILPTSDHWIAACLSAPVLWWHNYRHLDHGKDEALRPFGEKMLHVPIAPPSADAGATAAELVPSVVAAVAANQAARRSVLDALRLQYGVEKPGDALGAFHRLDADAFVLAVIRRRPKALGGLRGAQVAELRAVHAAEALPILRREQEVGRAERRLSDLVNAAYGLTDEDIALLRSTAPPRMPPGLPVNSRRATPPCQYG